MLKALSVVATVAFTSATAFGETVTVWAADLGLVPEYGRGYNQWDPSWGTPEEDWNEFVELGGGWDYVFPPYSRVELTPDMLRSAGWDEHDTYTFDPTTGEIVIYKDIFTDEDLAGWHIASRNHKNEYTVRSEARGDAAPEYHWPLATLDPVTGEWGSVDATNRPSLLARFDRNSTNDGYLPLGSAAGSPASVPTPTTLLAGGAAMVGLMLRRRHG